VTNAINHGSCTASSKKKKKVELGRIFGVLGWSWEILQTGFFMVILVARVVKL
jgi:hypothetical protein